MTADKIKLTLAVLIAAIGIGGFYYLEGGPDWVRYLTLFGALVLALVTAVLTGPGRAALSFAKEARLELRKVVWPTRKETMQMTLVVVVMVLVLALLLWLVDTGLQAAIKALVGQRV